MYIECCIEQKKYVGLSANDTRKIDIDESVALVGGFK